MGRTVWIIEAVIVDLNLSLMAALMPGNVVIDSEGHHLGGKQISATIRVGQLFRSHVRKALDPDRKLK